MFMLYFIWYLLCCLWQTFEQSVMIRPLTHGVWWVTCQAAGDLLEIPFVIHWIYLFAIMQCLTFFAQIMAERCCLDDQEGLGQGQARLEEQRQWQGQGQARLEDPFRKNPTMENQPEFLKMSLHSQKHLFALVAFICALHVFPQKPRSTVVCILLMSLTPVGIYSFTRYLEANCWH